MAAFFPCPRILGLFEKLTDSLSDHADATILVMGESTMTGADLLGCSNQLARYLRRARLPDGTRYLVNLAPGNWLSLLLITLVREGMPFLLCDEIVTSERDPDWFEKEKIGCVFLDSTTGAGWEEREIKKIVLDSAWEKIAAMSDGALQLRKATGPVVWEFGSADGVQRVRLGEALLANFLSVSAEFWGMTSASRLLSTSVPGTPSWLEETLLACLSGATLVHAGQDIFATRSAFQEALQELQITHLGLPAIRWSDWVHFLVELRQPLPPALQRVMIRSGRMGAKAVSEWLRLSKDQVRSSVFVSPFGLTAPGLGMDLNENLLPLIGAGLIPLGFPLGGSEIHVLASDDRILPSGAVGQLRLSLPANAVVDGVAASEKNLSLRGVMDASGLVCALSQPDVSSVGWTRPPVPVAAAAEATLLKRPEIFDAFVTRPVASGSSEGRQLQAWIIPQESGSSLPHGLAIWWKNEARFPWTLEAAAPIPKCPICKDGTLDTAALPAPSALAFKPSPTASQKTPSASTAAAPAPAEAPSDWEIQWVDGQPSERPCSVVLCGTFPHANLADALASGEAGAYAIGAAPIPRVGQLLKAQCGTVVCLAHGSDAWDFLRWINSLAPTDQERVRVLLVQPAIVENAPGIDTKLKSLWNKMLGRQTAGNSRREAGRGIRPVRCQISLRVLCSEEPETALITYLPEAEFFAGDLTSADTMAAAILDVLSEDAEEPEETQ
jgi:hypothetical protein